MSFDVCRICLAGNATYSPNTQLIHIYEKTTSNQWNRNQRPDKVCCLCHSLLKRCYKLSMMSKQSEVIFTQFFAGGLEFSDETIPILNQRKLYGLSMSSLQMFELGNIDSGEEIRLNEELPYEVKIEIEKEFPLEPKDDTKKEYNDYVKIECKNAENYSTHKEKVIYETSPNANKSHHISNKMAKPAPCITNITREMINKTKRNSVDRNELSDGRLSETIGKNSSFTLRFNLSDTKNGIMQNRTRNSFPFLFNKSLKELSDTNYTDSYCNKSFTKNNKLENLTVDSEYSCKDCNKTFSQKHYLEQHMKEHERRFACEECPKKFRQWSHKSQHFRSHHNIKPYECSICEKRFTQLSHIQQHRRTHTGESPYACDLCGKKFKQASNLMQHKMKHTEEKPYSCHICNKKFTQLGNLEQHKRVHTKERPFKCEHCNAGFSQKGNLHVHINRKHMKGHKK